VVHLEGQAGAQALAEAVKRVTLKETKIVFCTPELYCASPALQAAVKQLDDEGRVRIAIDEAHCLEDMGLEFRPAYPRMAQLFRPALAARILCVTATLDPTGCQRMCQMLQLEKPLIVRQPISRPDIVYSVVAKRKDPCLQLLEIIKQQQELEPTGLGIVYCLTPISRSSVKCTISTQAEIINASQKEQKSSADQMSACL
jgi:superfamily II DNA helicase RecQ